MKSNYEQEICQAIEVIADQKIKTATFDKTVEATILNCEDATLGKYRVKYQDASFIAYSSGDIIYENGTSVYVLIPGNDTEKDKIILWAGANYSGTELTTEDYSGWYGSGVGRFTNPEKNSEVFNTYNKYVKNDTYPTRGFYIDPKALYCHIEGGPNNNLFGSGLNVHLEGNANVAKALSNSDMNSLYGSHIEGSNNNLYYAKLNHIEGVNNTVNLEEQEYPNPAKPRVLNNWWEDCVCNHIEGGNHRVNGRFCHVEGSDNELLSYKAFACHIGGQGNTIRDGLSLNGDDQYPFCSFIMGSASAVYGGQNNFLMGQDNLLSAANRDVFLFGDRLGTSVRTIYSMSVGYNNTFSQNNVIYGTGNSVYNQYSGIIGSLNTISGANASFVFGQENSLSGQFQLVGGLKSNAINGNSNIIWGMYCSSTGNYLAQVGQLQSEREDLISFFTSLGFIVDEEGYIDNWSDKYFEYRYYYYDTYYNTLLEATSLEELTTAKEYFYQQKDRYEELLLIEEKTQEEEDEFNLIYWFFSEYGFTFDPTTKVFTNFEERANLSIWDTRYIIVNENSYYGVSMTREKYLTQAGLLMSKKRTRLYELNEEALPAYQDIFNTGNAIFGLLNKITGGCTFIAGQNNSVDYGVNSGVIGIYNKMSEKSYNFSRNFSEIWTTEEYKSFVPKNISSSENSKGIHNFGNFIAGHNNNQCLVQGCSTFGLQNTIVNCQCTNVQGQENRIVNSDYSFLSGFGLLAYNSDLSRCSPLSPEKGAPVTILGKFNDFNYTDNALFIIGNGIRGKRSNAFMVDYEGNVYCKSINKIPTSGSIQENPDLHLYYTKEESDERFSIVQKGLELPEEDGYSLGNIFFLQEEIKEIDPETEEEIIRTIYKDAYIYTLNGWEKLFYDDTNKITYKGILLSADFSSIENSKIGDFYLVGNYKETENEEGENVSTLVDYSQYLFTENGWEKITNYSQIDIKDEIYLTPKGYLESEENLPLQENSQEGDTYLIIDTSQEGDLSVAFQYIYLNGQWVKIGGAAAKNEEYVTKEELDTEIQNLTDEIDKIKDEVSAGSQIYTTGIDFNETGFVLSFVENEVTYQNTYTVIETTDEENKKQITTITNENSGRVLTVTWPISSE